MKPLLALVVWMSFSPAMAATSLQTQDIGGSSITLSGLNEIQNTNNDHVQQAFSIGSSTNGYTSRSYFAELIKCMDGASTVSSGTLVALYMTANTGALTDEEVFSSTTTAGNQPLGIVVDTNCVCDGTKKCLVATHGPARLNAADNTCAIGNSIQTSVNRGHGTATGSTSPGTQMATCLSTSNGTNGPAWIKLQ